MKIKSCSYFRGVDFKLPVAKNYDSVAKIAIEAPDKVYIPTKQMKGAKPVVVVSKGDEVKIGTRIAVSGNSVITSSVSGVVEEVITKSSVYGGTNEVVVITNNHLDTREDLPKFDPEFTDRGILLGALKASSIVDYDGESVLDKLSSVESTEESAVVVNLLDSEPYQNDIETLLYEYANDCATALPLVAKLFNTKNVMIAVSKKEQTLHNGFITSASEKCSELNLVLATLPNKYPLGDEVELVQAITKRKFKNKTKSRESGFVVFDVFTLYAIKKLIVDGEVVDRRPITIIEKDGEKIKSTSAWVKLGTQIKEVISALMVNGTDNIRKIVAGGPMRGIALGNEEASWTFSMKSVMAIKDKLSDAPHELPCITCGRCAKVCPVGLVPYEIDIASKNRDFSEAVKYGANECTKCGCCSYVCPSKRFLTQRIVYAKEIINNKGLNDE